MKATENPSTTVRPFDVGWRERALVLGTIAVLVLCLTLIGLRVARAQTLELLGLVPVTFFAIGKFLPLWSISGQSSFGPYQLGAVLWALDTLTVVLFVYSFEAIYRVAIARRALERVHHNMALVLQAYSWIRRLSLFGVFLFVLCPISGTGALAGSCIGMLLGANRVALIAVVSLGGLFGGLFMAFLAANFATLLVQAQAAQRGSSSTFLLLAIITLLAGGSVFWLSRAFGRALALAKRRD